jgi:phospholipid/cholesterol/gamma-HCH transport system ATP-binding protein
VSSRFVLSGTCPGRLDSNVNQRTQPLETTEAASCREPVIEVRDLASHYGERRILDGVDLQVRRGEILVIMGGSGSGKSTLLRHLLGLKRPSAGSIRLLGSELEAITKPQLYALRRRMGVAFQGGALFSSMSLWENVALPLRQHTRLDEKTIRIMTRMKLEMVNLGGFEDLRPAELSGGMLKRAGLARSLIMDPELLFFDEPSAGLDPVVSAELDALILRLREALSMTIVVVTHELESAFGIADRILVLDQGRVLVTGTVEEVRNTDNARVQDLLNRRPRNEPVDAEAYLRRLTGMRD